MPYLMPLAYIAAALADDIIDYVINTQKRVYKMRKIEKLMINAINSDKAFSLDNTLVTMHSIVNGYKFKVFLHGNHIANVYRNTFDIHRIEFSFAGWQTPTTKSRINALFSLMPNINGCYQKKGKLFFRAVAGALDNHIQINAGDWYSYNGAILQKLCN